MGTRKTLKSSHIRFGKRTFFVDVNESKNAKKYLKITQSEFVEEGKDRIYNAIVLFPDNIKEFQKVMADAAGFL